ncbi:DUF2922 domain-containing protein [Cytobacillus purgationiresistens]|uniref:DUF2922 domain-containing protein n=1 Tax=Cytobacillus purgationiresistens TaxID=863449 RepID=A0ABU0AEY5_9BACI|nr:DUF2922 domain-containing protein [Cytobacillus purgationiresistens]MDQ0269822.1 hypothetical protein [Cytobacillus purgationiresistens]
MTKTLELTFVNEEGGITRISIDQPKEPVDLPAIESSMGEMIAADVATSKSGSLTAVKGARLIERTVTDYDLS